MTLPSTPIEPQDYYNAVNTLNELLIFWLLVNRDAPDRGRKHRFVHDATRVLEIAEAKYGRSFYLPPTATLPDSDTP